MERVSLTAVKIARVVVAAGEDPRLAGLLPPGAADANRRLLNRAGLLDPWMQRLLANPGYRRFAGLIEQLFLPGFTLHVALRKRYFEDRLRQALRDRVSSVAVYGAGFDTLALRLAPEFPQTLFLEYDTPSTSALKARALGDKPPNLRLVALDLSRQEVEPPDVLVAEGLLMYLEPAEVQGLLAAAPTGSHVLFSFMTGSPVGRVPGLVELVLQLVGEPLRWVCPPQQLDRFLEAAGFTLVDQPTPAELRRRYGVPAGFPLAEFERVAVARKDR